MEKSRCDSSSPTPTPLNIEDAKISEETERNMQIDDARKGLGKRETRMLCRHVRSDDGRGGQTPSKKRKRYTVLRFTVGGQNSEVSSDENQWQTSNMHGPGMRRPPACSYQYRW